MARIKYASIVSSVSGSVGSATFQKSSFGDSLRNKPRPRHSGSPLQMERRSLIMQLHAAWAALTNAQRAQWNQFISYSSTKIRRDKNILQSGHSLFIQYNYLRCLAGYAVLSVPGYVTMPYYSNVITLGYISAVDLHLYTESTGDDSHIFFNLKLSSPRRPSLSFSRAGLKWLPMPHAFGEAWNIYSYLNIMFGSSYAIGDSIHYAIRFFSVDSPIMSGISTGVITVDDET